ncbi:MAG: two-component regulator propeller domain-containing protein [Cyclobacteriaceae bacterium]
MQHRVIMKWLKFDPGKYRLVSNYRADIKYLLYFLVLLLPLSDGPEAGAQTRFNRFEHLSVSNGFALNPVTSITQDRKGMMWFGTRKGLMRFDGVRLKNIANSPGDAFSLYHNDIYVLHTDSKGNIWTGTTQGLSVYNPVTNTGKNFQTNSVNGNISASILCIQELQSGEIWFGTTQGIIVYNPRTEAIKSIVLNPHEQEKPTTQVNCIFQASNGTVWVGSENGLYMLSKNTGNDYEFEWYKHSNENAESLVNNRVNVLMEDDNHRLWVGTHKGLDYIEPGSETFVHFSAHNSLTNDFIRALTLDKNGQLWVGTYNGINVIDSEFNVHQILHDPNNPYSLAGNKIRSLYTDNIGTVWVGSYYGGINYWDDKQLNFTRINENFGNHLSYNVVSCMEQDQRGNIYFGTEGEGISILNTKNGKFEHLNKLVRGHTIGSVKSMMIDNNDLWVGTFNKGLFRINLITKSFTQYKHEPGNQSSLSNDNVLAIARGFDQKLWVGTLNGGLNLFDPDKNTFKRFSQETDNPKSLPANAIRSLLVDGIGNCWIGVPNGLYVLRKDLLDKSVYEFERIANSKSNNVEVFDVLLDTKKNIWVGTTQNGLFRLIDDQLVAQELPGVSSVLAIVEDERQVLWFSSTNGILSYDYKNNKTRLYDIKDGVKPNEFMRAAGLISKDGRVYFGGASGLSTFLPEELGRYNDYAPDVSITDFQLFDRQLNAGDSTGILTRAIGYTEEITLDYDQNNFTIHFALPNFIKTDKNTYQYRLLGLEDKWNNTSIPSVSYTIQRGGDYTFEVKGKNSDGFNTVNTTRLKINLLNPPWRTWWAFLIYAVIIAAALYLLISIYQSRIRLQHKLELETQEFLRHEEANQQKLQFFTNISHEFRTPLTLILGPLQKIIHEYKGSNVVYRQLLVIKKNTDQLFKLINELMDFRKLENKQMKLQAAEGDLVKFTQEIYLSFKQQARMGQYKYTFESTTSDLNIYFDRDKFEKVLYNLISNAFKYTPRKGSIKVVIKDTPAGVEIRVVDSGDGIAADQLSKVFDRFYEVPGQKNHGTFKQGSGIGLAIAKSIVDLHKGTIKVESRESEGSSFIVTLPAGRKHLSDEEVIDEFKNSEDISQYQNQQPAEVDAPSFDVEDFMDSDNKADKLVLVVEDNRQVAEFIRSVLKKNYRVVLAENGALGYNKAISEQPNLIISDVMMPEMDGIEFCARVKSDIRTSHIPFILLTARTSLVYKYDGLESGADEYLNKPFEIKELLLKCKNIINTQEKLKAKFSEHGEFYHSGLSVNSLDKKMMDQAMKIIRDNLSNQFFSIQLFCTELGTSRSLLFTKFKAWTNQTPNEFILGMRMKYASKLIEQNNMNISQVSNKVGFKDANYFSKCFKKQFDLSPKEYSEKFTETA